MFHPVEIVVERVIDAVVAAETDIDRGDARVIEEGTEIGSGTEVTERRLTARLALWRLPGNSGRLLFGASDVPTPGFVNAAAGFGVLDLPRGVAHEVLERRCGRGAEVRAGNANVGVNVGDRLCLQLGAIRLDPFGRTDQAGLFGVPLAYDDRALRLPAGANQLA